MKIKIILSGLFLGCLLLGGCSGHQASHETEQQVLSKYRPRADALSATLHRIAAILPQRVDPKAAPPAVKPDPPMSLVYGPGMNTHFVAESQLLDVQTTPRFDAWSGDSMILFLRWMDSTKSEAPSEEQGDPIYSSADAERLLSTKYIVVLRVVDYAPPKAVDPDDIKAGYAGGGATLDVFVVNLDTSQVLDAYTVTAEPSKEVWLEYSKKDSTSDVTSQMEDQVLRTMENDAQHSIIQGLKDRLNCQSTL